MKASESPYRKLDWITTGSKKRLYLDITGNKYWRLTVLGFSHVKNDHYYWSCKCDCGSLVTVEAHDLKTGHTTSCGCFRLQRQKEINLRHGLSYHPLHSIWDGVKTRIFNKNSEAYKNYGGRGISLCDEWMDFVVFYEWAMSHGYEKGLTLERVNNEKGYCPSNCKWIPKNQQAKNRRINIMFNGENAAEAGRRLGASYGTVHSRVKAGWSLEEAFTKPVRYHGNIQSI